MNPVLKGRLLQVALSRFILICGAAIVGEMFMFGIDTLAKHALSSFLRERNFSFSSCHSKLFLIISVANNLSFCLLLISSLVMCLHKSNTKHQTKAVGVRGLDLAFQGCDSQLSNNTIFITFSRLITVGSKKIHIKENTNTIWFSHLNPLSSEPLDITCLVLPT